MERRGVDKIAKYEKCPQCGAEVIVRAENTDGEYHRLALLNPDNSAHRCDAPQFHDHAIGAAMLGRTITDYQLRGRVLTLTLDNGNVYQVSAPGRPLNVQLTTKTGMLQE